MTCHNNVMRLAICHVIAYRQSQWLDIMSSRPELGHIPCSASLDFPEFSGLSGNSGCVSGPLMCVRHSVYP